MTQRLPDWFQDWSRDVCIIVASGPSANQVSLEPCKDRAKFIAINSSWKLCPWADVLIGADGGWWQRYKGCPDFKGLKITLDWNAHRDFGLKLLKLVKHVQGISVDTPGMVGTGGNNSGFYAINLAIQFQCKKIFLVGFDMTVKHGEHWHGKHEKGLNNPNEFRCAKWRAKLDETATQIKNLGVEVVNCSPISALKNYRKCSLNECFCNAVNQ